MSKPETKQNGDSSRIQKNSPVGRLPITGKSEKKEKAEKPPTLAQGKRQSKPSLPSSLSTQPEILIAMLLENSVALHEVENMATHITGNELDGGTTMISIHIIAQDPRTIDYNGESIIFDGKEI